MKELLEVVIYILATWRLASLVTDEAGPGHVFQHLREFTGIEHDEDGKKTIIPLSFLGELFSCLWCASIWCAACWVVFDLVWPEVAVRVAMVFALSGGAILVQRLVSKD